MTYCSILRPNKNVMVCIKTNFSNHSKDHRVIFVIIVIKLIENKFCLWIKLSRPTGPSSIKLTYLMAPGSERVNDTGKNQLYYTKTELTKRSVCPAETQICLGIRIGWSQPSLSDWRGFGSLATYTCIALTLIRLGGCEGWTSRGAYVICMFYRVSTPIV